jgi:peptidoglycan/LPS O-acetylase OafA/YrhL
MTLLLDPPSLRGRSNGIDLLRGWFALQVLIFAHVVNWSVYLRGKDAVAAPIKQLAAALIVVFQSRAELNPAVIGFIVLSGYCIHRNGLRTGRPLTPYFIRRGFRILPIFYLGSALGVIFYYLSTALAPAAASALTGTARISASCLLAKLTAIASILPIAHPCDYAGNAPLLTVMVEIGLYAFYALVFFIGGASVVYCACGASIIVGLAIAAMNLRHPLLYDWWQNSSLLAFLPYWWIGAAAIQPAIRRWIMAHWLLFFAAWLTLTMLSAYLDPTAITAEIRKLVFAGLITCLVVKFDRDTMPANPISFIGKAGYSIYAIHAPLAVYLVILGLPWWITCAIVVAAGLFSYFAFERPLNLTGHRFAKAVSSVAGSEATQMSIAGNMVKGD